MASAPGRVEPRSGLIRIGTSLPGKVEAVAVNMNDKVAEGEVLIRIEDKEARARLAAAEAKAATTKKDRDAVAIPAGRESVSKAEDAVFTAERAVTSARFELDDALAVNRKNASNPNALVNARRRLADANDRLRQEQSTFATAQNKGGVPPPNALEAALIARPVGRDAGGDGARQDAHPRAHRRHRVADQRQARASWWRPPSRSRWW